MNSNSYVIVTLTLYHSQVNFTRIGGVVVEDIFGKYLKILSQRKC